jgi:hypothetical protein
MGDELSRSRKSEGYIDPGREDVLNVFQDECFVVTSQHTAKPKQDNAEKKQCWRDNEAGPCIVSHLMASGQIIEQRAHEHSAPNQHHATQPKAHKDLHERSQPEASFDAGSAGLRLKFSIKVWGKIISPGSLYVQVEAASPDFTEDWLVATIAGERKRCSPLLIH